MTKHLTISNTFVPSCGYSSEEAKGIAQTILAQLGGSRALTLMLGAKHFSSHNDEGRGALSFKFKGSRKVNYVKIILTVMDTYTVRFGKIGKFDYDIVEQLEDIYCDNLAESFRRVTGLETRVPRIVGINA